MKQNVDPGARQLLDQMVAAHQALFSYSAQVKVEAISEKLRETATATIVYQKPNRCRVEVSRTNKTKVLSVCDGTSRLYAASLSRRKVKAEQGEKALIESLSQANLFIAPVFLYLTSRLAPVKEILPGNAKALGFGTPTSLDGVAVEVVAADVVTKDGEARLTFTIGKEDRLLRRILVQTSFQGDVFTLGETYTDVKGNPKVAPKTFALT